MCTGRLDVQLQEGPASDRAAVLPGPLPAGALRLADLGYWSLEAFAALEQPKVFWLSRLQMQTAVDDATGERRELPDLLETQAMDSVELAVALGERQRLAARLLVLGTYRPVEVMLRAHPLRGMVQELCGRGQGKELRLELLSPEDVAAYVAGRLGGPVAAPLTALVAARTNGNALFMVNIVEHLVQQGVVVWRAGQWTLREGTAAQVASLPAGLAALLLRRIEALPPEARWVLEAASVVGEAFAVAAVAAGVQRPIEDVEAMCEGLAAQRAVLDNTGWTAWPDGTRGGVYRFQHALYRQVLYESLGTMRCVQLHWRVGRGWRQAMAPRRARSPPSSPSTSSAGARSRGPCTIGGGRGTLPPGVMPITTPSPPSPKGWRSSRHSPTAPSAPTTNSRCYSCWGSN